MPRALEGARKSTPPAELVSTHGSEALLAQVLVWLDDAKAEKVVTIDIKEKSSLGDFMVIASGRSDRHVGAVAEQIQRRLKEEGHGKARIEGDAHCDWVVIDIGDIIVHVFRPEVREFYNLEKMWSGERPTDPVTH
jgi:ribosome-associated protein